MGCHRGYSFPFDFEPTGNPFGSKSKGNLSPRSHPIQYERKWKTSFLSVVRIVFFFLQDAKIIRRIIQSSLACFSGMSNLIFLSEACKNILVFFVTTPMHEYNILPSMYQQSFIRKHNQI